MTPYFISLAFSGAKRPVFLGLLIIASIAVGISASATMLIVAGTFAIDPLPAKSAVLYHVQLDPRDGDLSKEPNPLATLTLKDARGIYQLAEPGSRTYTAANWLPLRSNTENPSISMQSVRAFTNDAFDIFDMHFSAGHGWNSDDDQRGRRVAVISDSLARDLFPDSNAVGKTIQLATKDFEIIGTIEDWNPHPRFYDLSAGAYKDAENIFLPFESWLMLPQDYGHGEISCWNGAASDIQSASCAWIQFWVELDNSSKAATFTNALASYSANQKYSGRTSVIRTRTLTLKEWLDFNQLMPASVKMQSWFSLGILLLCLINASGLLLAKFMHRSAEIGIRRALGASRKQIFLQFMTESFSFGVLGGIVGTPMAILGLWLIREQPLDYAGKIPIEWHHLATSPLLAIFFALLAGAIPAWRASAASSIFESSSQ